MMLLAFFTLNGDPETGLSPTITVVNVADGLKDVDAQAMSETSSANAPGWYHYDFSTYDETLDYVITADAATDEVDDRYPHASNVSAVIENGITDIKGTGFAKDTDSLVDLSHKAGAKGTDEIHDDLEIVDGIVDDILVDTNEMQGKLPTNNIMGSSDKSDKDDEIDAILLDTGTTIPGTLSTMDGKLDTIDNEIAAMQGDVTDILADTNEMQGKLPTNNIMGSSDKADYDGEIGDILADTNEMQGKLPTNNIMGSSVKTDKDDEIDDIKTNIGTPVALDGGSATIGSMLTKMADDNGGADFDATTDSLHEIADAISAGVVDWTAAEKDDIRDALGVVGAKGAATGGQLQDVETHLEDIKGTGFVKDTDSLVDLAHTGADGDTLKTLSDQIDAITGGGGSGTYNITNLTKQNKKDFAELRRLLDRIRELENKLLKKVR